jgi:divalent metal cation (Fe/Co/Zn/Cd) transporter
MRVFRRVKGSRSVWSAIATSKDPTTFVVLLEDSAALIGLSIAAAGIFLAGRFGEPRIDGVASILIGITLCAVALILLRETRGLLLGEAVEPQMLESIRRILGAEASVRRVGRVLTMYLGPHEVLVNAEVEFDPSVSAAAVQQAIAGRERALRAAHPDIAKAFIEATPPQQQQQSAPPPRARTA